MPRMDPRPPKPLTAAEQMRECFLDALLHLDTEQWRIVSHRAAAERAALAALQTKIAKRINGYLTARLASDRHFQEHTIAFNRWAHARLLAAVEALPEQIEDGGQRLALRSAAFTAAQTADAVLRLFEPEIGDKTAAALATPGLRPFAGFVPLPALPDQPTTTDSLPAKARRGAARNRGFDAKPATTFHLRFPEDYFVYDEPPPAGVTVVPLSWNRRNTTHETWDLPPRSDLECRFGGEQEGSCAMCGGPLHHLITLPALAGIPLGDVTSLSVVTCMSCLGWSAPLLYFAHDATGKPQPTGVARPGQPAELVAEALRPTTIHLCETPARWRRQRWEDADGQNLSRIGGTPSWVQDPEVPRCCSCGKRMVFLLQVDSGLPTLAGKRWDWGSGGVLFAFWCRACRIDGQLWQCS